MRDKERNKNEKKTCKNLFKQKKIEKKTWKIRKTGKEISMRENFELKNQQQNIFREKKMKQHIHTKKNYYIRQAGLIYIR